jgi:hypothetical protein
MKTKIFFFVFHHFLKEILKIISLDIIFKTNPFGRANFPGTARLVQPLLCHLVWSGIVAYRATCGLPSLSPVHLPCLGPSS